MEPEPRSAERSTSSDRPMTTREPVVRWRGNECELTSDNLAIEEPLQIRMAGEDVAVTMRTPGHDLELAVGFLYSEGLIASKEQIEAFGYCVGDDGQPTDNVVNVTPTERNLVDPRHWGRDFLATSSCGLCGKTSIRQVVRDQGSWIRVGESASVSLETLYSLPEKLRAGQEAFAQTGGIHAAGLFDLEGNLLVLREDIGRHNAVDKVIGYALLNEMLPLNRYILLVSSRASFEIVQKALVAGVSIMAVVSAPSSMAVQLAREAEMTLVAFLRQGRLNAYAGEERIRE